MFTVLLVDKVSLILLSTAHASYLLVIPCSALAVTLWFFVEIYIARSSAKIDLLTPFPSFPKMPLITTRNKSHLVLWGHGLNVKNELQIYRLVRTIYFL